MGSPALTERQPRGGKRNRNAFVRTVVSPLERVISIVIVCLLAAIGAAIWIKGKHFDPNLYSLRTDALNSTVSTVQGKAGTLRESNAQPGEETAAAPQQPAAATRMPAPREDGESSGEEAAANSPASAPAAAIAPMEVMLPGINPMGKTEFYSPDTLYEKIDGRAPAYLDFNFQQLRNRSFSVAGAKDSYVDVYEYRMDTPLDAFGMFASERDPNGKPLDFAPDGYSGEMGYFFRQGAIYVQVIASDQNPATLAAARAIAGERAKSIPEDNTGLDGRSRLPSAGMVPGSITFVPNNAQGQEFLKNVFQAAYDFDGAKVSFFIMPAAPKVAADAWKSYLDFSGKLGGKAAELPDVKGAKIFQAENFGKCKIIYQREGELGGVIDAQDAETARKFVEDYLQGNIR